MSSPGRTRTVDRLVCKPGAFAAGPQDYVFQSKREDQGLEPRSVTSASRVQNGFLIQPDVFHTNQRP